MSRLNRHSGSWPRGAWHAALALAALGQFAVAAAAEPRIPGSALFKLDLGWTTSLMPVPAVPVDAAEPPPLVSFDDAPNQLFSQAASPGLQFSLDPDNEEVFLGWQFEF
jgi:hypothetical protein